MEPFEKTIAHQEKVIWRDYKSFYHFRSTNSSCLSGAVGGIFKESRKRTNKGTRCLANQRCTCSVMATVPYVLWILTTLSMPTLHQKVMQRSTYYPSTGIIAIASRPLLSKHTSGLAVSHVDLPCINWCIDANIHRHQGMGIEMIT